MTRYTAEVGAENAAWLAAQKLLDGTTSFAGCFTGNGDGTAAFGADTLNALRELDEHQDGCVDADNFMWIEGDGFKVAEVP